MSDHFWNLQDERGLFLIAMFIVKSTFNGENPSRSSEHFGDVYLKTSLIYLCTESQAGYISLANCTVSFGDVSETSLCETCLWSW